ncbi:hypothetical protein Sru01_37460 [Sphaerisporangium rufum]|uniref:Uncharacterized protein n=1 Tax=Sphaerisporangium rufum TaxID=1381558 RepID=A0A919V0H3_9ACTN|nr:hypothetical protein Sru01_37460 [Sphaerisporangium rufum]
MAAPGNASAVSSSRSRAGSSFSTVACSFDMSASIGLNVDMKSSPVLAAIGKPGSPAGPAANASRTPGRGSAVAGRGATAPRRIGRAVRARRTRGMS